jgi:hypothetical protein
MHFGKIILAVIYFTVINWTGSSGAVQAASASTEPPAVRVGPDTKMYEPVMNTAPPTPQRTILSPPVALGNRETPILGTPEVAPEQMIKYILQNNPTPKLTCPVAELVNIYYEEAGVEGVRPDLAIAQAVLETGFFCYGGDVLPEQNNYAGIGATGYSRGVWFSSAREGVRAHIQHLLAYSTTREPYRPIVNPRYYIAREIHLAQCPTWESLGGKWAVPGINYGQRILSMLERAKQM